MNLLKYKIHLGTFCFLLFSVNCLGQSSCFRDYTLNFKYHYGFIMKHSENMAHLANQRPSAFELELSQQTTGKQRFAQLYNFPRIGISAHYYLMDRHKPLGNMLGIYPHISFIIIRQKKHELNFRVGWGLGYIERRFDLNDNYKNNLISSRINYTLSGRLNYTFKIGRYNINAGIGLLHFSNGAMKVPNLGINVPTIHLGIGLNPKENPEFKKDSLPPYKRSWNFYLSTSGGIKRIYPVNGSAFFLSSTSIYFGRSLNRKSTIMMGTDIMYDPSGKHDFDGDEMGIKFIDFKWGLTAGHELSFSRISLLTQFGYYLYDPLKLAKPVYQRYGLKYYINKNYFAGIALRAHFGTADLVEYSLGVKF
jgi:hypothetical protein